MTIQGALYLAVMVLSWLPLARAWARAESLDRGEPGDVLWALWMGAVCALAWPLLVVAAAVWWLVNRGAVGALVIPESDDAKIRRLEQRNAELEQELGL